MRPSELRPDDFAAYPPQAHALAVASVPMLRSLPLVLAPFLLREIATYDWKFPAERLHLRQQLAYVCALPPQELGRLTLGFQSVTIKPGLERLDWVNDPAGFIEQLTAWLWSSHQMEHFHEVADAYWGTVAGQSSSTAPRTPRMGLVAIGQGATPGAYRPFRKLRAQGVHLTAVDPQDGFAILLAAAESRANADRISIEGSAAENREAGMEHWYLDGGTAVAASQHITCVSYQGLQPAREQLLAHTQRAIATGSMGPEKLRTMLARLRPADVGLPDRPEHASLSRFQLSLLTEGSGTQIFATTFAQWTARECIRRAEPKTLLLRFAPRQQAQTMDAMLGGAASTGTDAEGSLVDADQGAYYTWLNMRRLSGADALRFVVWFEGQREAVVIGPGLPAGTTSSTAMDMHGVFKLLA